MEDSGKYWKSALFCMRMCGGWKHESGFGGLGAKAASEAGFREMGKSLGLWEIISNIWRSVREFRSLCGILNPPVLFQQIDVKRSDMQNLHPANFGMETVTALLKFIFSFEDCFLLIF